MSFPLEQLHINFSNKLFLHTCGVVRKYITISSRSTIIDNLHPVVVTGEPEIGYSDERAITEAMPRDMYVLPVIL